MAGFDERVEAEAVQPGARRTATVVLAGLVILVAGAVLIAALPLLGGGPHSTPGEWVTTEGGEFRVTSAEFSHEFLVIGPTHLTVRLEMNGTPMGDLRDAWVRDAAGHRMYCYSSDLFYAEGTATLAFPVPERSGSVVLHFADGQTIDLEPWLGR